MKVLALLFLLSGIGYCVDQPHNIGYVKAESQFGLPSYTLAQMNVLVPATTGYVINVVDAVQSRICTSSGSLAGAWVVASATGTFVGGSYPHCQ